MCIRDRVKVFRAIRSLEPGDLVRGQFRGYRDERGVAAGSTVETFAAATLHIDTWRWADVPFFLRAGKCLAAHAIELRVQFKRPPREVFPESSLPPEYFRFRVGPDVSALAVGLHVKRPGESMVGQEVELLASECEAGELLPYERLLGDAIRGDASLFGRQDSIEEQWRIVDPVLDMPTPPHPYERGTWGPVEADRLVAVVPGGWQRPIDPRRA